MNAIQQRIVIAKMTQQVLELYGLNFAKPVDSALAVFLSDSATDDQLLVASDIAITYKDKLLVKTPCYFGRVLYEPEANKMLWLATQTKNKSSALDAAEIYAFELANYLYVKPDCILMSKALKQAYIDVENFINEIV